MEKGSEWRRWGRTSVQGLDVAFVAAQGLPVRLLCTHAPPRPAFSDVTSSATEALSGVLPHRFHRLVFEQLVWQKQESIIEEREDEQVMAFATFFLEFLRVSGLRS